ncbi:MAG: formylmethanofuran dehydrogenase subunit C [Gammaproteobacteria bacterium]|nr:formylmethanofuran dehydrogenase subunit C [Gammaproteobacteria bacterium]
MISLTLNVALTAGLDLAAINPTAFAGLNLAKIERLRIQYGPAQVRLADLFRITGTLDESLEINSESATLHGIGSALNSGKITLNGDAGDYLGAGMRGGEVVCAGNAGERAAAGMRGGRIEVTGSVGNFAGGTLMGATTGMKGGALIVGKHAGARLGDRMRRGLIMVRGNVGPQAGSQMIAGTLALLGGTATGLGTGMRRGTLLVADRDAVLPASFVVTGCYALPFVAVLCRHLAALKPPWRSRLAAFTEIERAVGDRGCDGLGEILIARGE